VSSSKNIHQKIMGHKKTFQQQKNFNFAQQAKERGTGQKTY
jgi:hypothetical protein